MVYSMTGFGRYEQEFGTYSVMVEVRSVNSRYLDINMRLPDILSGYENALKKSVQHFFNRGQVSVKVALNGASEKLSHLTINKELLQSYDRLIQEIRQELSLTDKPNVSDYLDIPELISYEQQLPEEDELYSNVSSVLGQALEDVQRMRKEEGKSLQEDMIGRLTWLEESMETIQAEAGENSAQVKKALEKRITDLLESVPVDQDRLVQELAYMADKVDITEETVRFASHIKQFRSLLNTDSEIGKKLNFLLQEMNREINTIGAKANNAVISHTVVDCKNEIEKLREQVQNIE